jgi:hypothetical protein
MSKDSWKADNAYFSKSATEASAAGLLDKKSGEAAEDFKRNLASKEEHYRKVSTKAVTKRYAIRKD